MANRIKWSLVGVPDHQGVMNVGGRLGAAHGPKHLIQLLKKMTGPAEIWTGLASEKTVEGLTAEIENNLECAANTVAEVHPLGGISCVIGGGHDHGYSHLLGVRRSLERSSPFGNPVRIGCVNIDAHLDVRAAIPVVSSGSPFRIAIERGVIRGADLIEFGIQSHCNAPSLWDFVRSEGIQVFHYRDLRDGQAVDSFAQSLKKLAPFVDAIVVSLDLDAAAESHSPGVSAPQSEGFTSSELIAMMEIAGEHPKVHSLGVFELNPLHDVGERTARLGATCVYHFVEKALNRLDEK